tara:strand:+ start:95 stop:469 length:375 start_codon:yes stop_codon:yes gene_type:complete
MAFKMNGWSAFTDTVTKNRKRHARSIREGVGNVTNDGKVETHRMVSDIQDNPTGIYHVWPSITFDDQGNKKEQSAQEAFEAGEMYKFKNKKKAEKFAYGSWKKGKARREAMRDYRKMKRQRKNK